MGTREQGLKIRAALQKTLAAMPAIQDRFAETGDPAELDQAEKTIDRLSAMAERFASKGAQKVESAVPVANTGGGDPPPESGDWKITKDPSTREVLERSMRTNDPGGPGFPQLNAAAPAAPLAPSPAGAAVKKAFTPLQDPPDIAGAKRLNLPKAIQRNSEDLREAHAQLYGALMGAQGKYSIPQLPEKFSADDLAAYKRELEASLPDKEIKQVPGTFGTEEVDGPAREQKAEVLRLVNNIIKDDIALGKLTGRNDPQRQRWDAMRKAGALSPSEIESGKVNAPPPAAPRVAGPAKSPEEIAFENEKYGEIDPRTGRPSSETQTGGSDELDAKLQQALPQIKKDFGGDPALMIADVKKLSEMEQADQDERDYIEMLERRVNREIGPRPKRFTIEKLLTALTVGASAVASAWITRRYAGQAGNLNLNEDQRLWDARNAQIGREVFSAMEGRIRQRESERAADERLNISIGAQEKRQKMRLDAEAATNDAKLAIQRFNARLRELEVTNRAAAVRLRMYGESRRHQIMAERDELRNMAGMVEAGQLDMATYKTKEAEVASEIARLAAEIEAAALGK